MTGTSGLTERGTMVHIRCGDDLRGLLQDAKLVGQYVRWADPLCQGPTPANIPTEQWRELRARHAAEHYGVTLEHARQFLDDQDQELETSLRLADGSEIILWFEHDLFDQIILIYLLGRLRTRDLGGRRISLVFAGQHLAHLNTAAILSLWETRRPVTASHYALAQRAWAAFCAADPLVLQELLRSDLSGLPYLHNAVMRHLAEYPGLNDGLGLTERLAVEAIARGARALREVFQAVQGRERAAWLSDTMFWPYLQRLAAGDEPLLHMEEGTFSLTPRGRKVLNQEDDWTRTPSSDRWLGGVLLQGGRSAWRWDDQQQQLYHLS